MVYAYRVPTVVGLGPQDTFRRLLPNCLEEVFSETQCPMSYILGNSNGTICGRNMDTLWRVDGSGLHRESELNKPNADTYGRCTYLLQSRLHARA